MLTPDQFKLFLDWLFHTVLHIRIIDIVPRREDLEDVVIEPLLSCSIISTGRNPHG